MIRPCCSLVFSRQTVECDAKLNALVAFLREHASEKTIVYVDACAVVDYFARILPALLGPRTLVPLHGKIVAAVSVPLRDDCPTVGSLFSYSTRVPH